MQQRLENLEGEMETVKELLMSAARYAESASRGLDRVSAQQETNALAIERLVEQQSRTDAAIEALTGFAGEVFKSIQEMQSEVRGLQTENRRILDRLERHMGDGHGVEQ